MVIPRLQGLTAVRTRDYAKAQQCYERTLELMLRLDEGHGGVVFGHFSRTSQLSITPARAVHTPNALHARGACCSNGVPDPRLQDLAGYDIGIGV